MSKIPRLNEVFTVTEAEAWKIKGKLRPEQEAIVDKYAKQFLDYAGHPGDPVKNDMAARIKDILRSVIVASEEAEGEGDLKDVEQ